MIEDCDLIAHLDTLVLNVDDCKSLIQIVFESLGTGEKVQEQVQELLFE